MCKRTIVRRFVNFTHGWNKELHQAIEGRVQAEYKRMFSDGTPKGIDSDATMETMRSFYYQRMMTTANLLLSGSTFIVSVVALLFSLIALIKK